MRLGTAARHWSKIAPSEEQYREYRAVLARAARVLEPPLELCYVPWSVEDGLRAALLEPPATLLVLPNGRVKVAAALPNVCAAPRRMASRRLAGVPGGWRNEATRLHCGARSTTSRPRVYTRGRYLTGAVLLAHGVGHDSPDRSATRVPQRAGGSPAAMFTIRVTPSRENVSFTVVTALAVLRPSATSVFRTTRCSSRRPVRRLRRRRSSGTIEARMARVQRAFDDERVVHGLCDEQLPRRALCGHAGEGGVVVRAV
jgi:hypothetical protein